MSTETAISDLVCRARVKMDLLAEQLRTPRPGESFYREFESALGACGAPQSDSFIEMDLGDGRLDGYRFNLTALLVRLAGVGAAIFGITQIGFAPGLIAGLVAAWELLSVKETLSPAAVAVVALLWVSKPSELTRADVLARAEILLRERTGIVSSEVDFAVALELLKEKGIVEESPVGLSLTEVCWVG